VNYFFIGDPELVTAFRFIGVEGTVVRDSAEAAAVFQRITSGSAESGLPGGCRVLILTEEVASWLDELVVKWQISGSYPVVVEIPGILGRLPGKKTLVELIHEAIGVHI
jgi:V/A-type H+-transporting ATPase subunit F